MRKIWQSLLRRNGKPKIDAKYLPCRIYGTPKGYLWQVTHHGKIVAQGTSDTFRQAVRDADRAIAPSKIVIGQINDKSRDR